MLFYTFFFVSLWSHVFFAVRSDTIVMVTASELYMTEDQARSLKESSMPMSPSAPTTPRRRHHRELDLDNIIQVRIAWIFVGIPYSSCRKRTYWLLRQRNGLYPCLYSIFFLFITLFYNTLGIIIAEITIDSKLMHAML